MKNKLFFFLCCLLCFALSSRAQTNKAASVGSHQWYVGVQGGVPFGVSTFSSFASDKTHWGLGGGLFVGYRFSRLLSGELVGDYNRLTLGARSCCTDADLWLGSDGNHYYAPVANMTGWSYSTLKSCVDAYNVGLRLNVDMLHLLLPSACERFSLLLSPSVGAASTKAHITDRATGDDVSRGSARWHLAAGGAMSVNYNICPQLTAGLYSGLTFMTGKHFDDMPEYLHHQNFVWQSGVRLTFAFGKSKSAKTSSSDALYQHNVSPQQPLIRDTLTPMVDNPKHDTIAAVAPESLAVDTTTVGSELVDSAQRSELPIVYFAFNSCKIRPSQMPALHRLARVLKHDSTLKIKVIGWADKRGNAAVNKRMSVQRARAVRQWLMSRGIKASRILINGNGIDFNAANNALARRADSTPIVSIKEDNQ